MLSETARRRIAALLLLAGIVIAVLAIKDVGPFDDPPTPQEEVRATLVSFFGDAAKGDFKAYCGLLTQGARDTVRSNAVRLLQGKDAGGCSNILKAFGKALEGGKLKIHTISVSGNRARAEVNYNLAKIKTPSLRTVLLELDGDEWHISDPG